jgi:hypothetical protein
MPSKGTSSSATEAWNASRERIGLGVAELLGVRQRVGVAHSRPGHLGEDVVGRAVDDSVHLLDVRARERLADDADHGHDAGDRCLVAKLCATPAGGGQQLVAVLAQKLLVGGDDSLARAERGERVLPSGLDPADQLDDRVGAGKDLIEAPLRTRQHARDFGPSPNRGLDRVRALGQELREGRPDRPVTEQADSKGLAHSSRAARSS